MKLQDPQDRSAAAGEYVLGTLGAAERAEFERALATDDALQAEVYAWQDRLLGLARRAAPVDVPPALWPRIEGGLADARPLPVSRSAAANDPAWRRLRFWQTVSGVAVAASLVLGSVLLLRAPAPPAEAARYLALLQAPDRTTGWVVEVTAGDRVRLVPVGETPPLPPGKALQFWTKPAGAAGPTSLGLVPPGKTTEVPVARLPALGEQQLFELTLEAEGGSTIGRPTGPVLFVGRTVRL